MTISGAPKPPSRSANSFSTSVRLLASQAKVLAPISLARPSRSAGVRAASATLMPSVVSTRANAALRPEPAPTISAVLNFTVGIASLQIWLNKALNRHCRSVGPGGTITQSAGANDAGGLLREERTGARRSDGRRGRHAQAGPG